MSGRIRKPTEKGQAYKHTVAAHSMKETQKATHKKHMGDLENLMGNMKVGGRRKRKTRRRSRK
jgi:hypothetical protein